MLTDNQKALIKAMAANDLVLVQAAAALGWTRAKATYQMRQLMFQVKLDPRCFYDMCDLIQMLEEEERHG